jgi:hypothetical protein
VDQSLRTVINDTVLKRNVGIKPLRPKGHHEMNPPQSGGLSRGRRIF